MNRREILVACAALPSALGSTPAAGGEISLTEELLRLERRRQEAYAAGDRTVLESQFAEEYIHTNLRGGRTALAEELEFYAPGRFSLGAGRIDDVTVRDYGDVATLIATVSWEAAVYRPAPSVAVDLSGRFAVSRVYVRRDGDWRLALSHATLIASPA